MASKQSPKPGGIKRQALRHDKGGDLYADVPSDNGAASVRISFRRAWYSPPFTESGEIDYQAVSSDLAQELSDGTIVIRNYLENGELGFGAEIHVDSKEELESTLRTIRKVYNEGLKEDNATRKAALDRCKAKLAELEEQATSIVDMRREMERRIRERRGRQLLGRTWFRKDNRRIGGDRRQSTRRQSA